MTRQTTRRGVLAGLPAAAVMAPAAAGDPIFAAIEALKQADDEAGTLQDEVDMAEHRAMENSGRPREEWFAWYMQDPDSYQACRDRGVPADLADRYRNARAAVTAAVDQLAATKPTTLAGAVALLDFWIADDPLYNGERDWHAPAIENVAATLKRMAT